mmetsp:Transcript_45614/g.108552  ORF Transcript_45614/g.108552 Transcript_45614/m.108552 type:complete len:225 (-) Transcript_45614:360-1034(-)
MQSWNSTMAVPSLNKDSPLTNMVRRGLTPRELKMATTATGSVALRMEPKSRAVGQSQPYGNMYLPTTAIIPVPSTTPGPARIMHCQKHLLTRVTFKDMASLNTSGGKKQKSSKCGSARIQRPTLISKVSHDDGCMRAMIKPSTNNVHVYGRPGTYRSSTKVVPTPMASTENKKRSTTCPVWWWCSSSSFSTWASTSGISPGISGAFGSIGSNQSPMRLPFLGVA